MSSCIPTDTSLANPSIYTTVLHTLTCILVPVNLFGAYCILIKSPKKMESVKWLMLNLHCLSLLLDFSVSFLGVPYALYPAPAGYPLGVLDIPAITEIYIFVTLLAAVGVAILTVFENRYYVLFGENTWWEKARKPILIIDHLLVPLYLVQMFITVPEQEAAILEISKILPCTPPLFVNGRKLFVMAVDIQMTFICVSFMSIWTAGQIIIFVAIIIIKLIKRARNSSVNSSRTNELQRKFVIALGLQTLVPFSVLLVPTSYVGFCQLFSYHNQLLNNLTFTFYSAHGLLSTVIMISVHQPYRDFVLGPFRGWIDKRKVGTVIQPKLSVTQISVVQ